MNGTILVGTVLTRRVSRAEQIFARVKDSTVIGHLILFTSVPLLALGNCDCPMASFFLVRAKFTKKKSLPSCLSTNRCVR